LNLRILSSYLLEVRVVEPIFRRRSLVLRLSKMYEPIKNYKLTSPKETILELFWLLKVPKTLLLFHRASNPRFSLVPQESPTQLECTLSIHQTS